MSAEKTLKEIGKGEEALIGDVKDVNVIQVAIGSAIGFIVWWAMSNIVGSDPTPLPPPTPPAKPIPASQPSTPPPCGIPEPPPITPITTVPPAPFSVMIRETVPLSRKSFW